jgi:predicted RNA-binding Zn-ribbon protein involved in translation (DUF1610 family)
VDLSLPEIQKKFQAFRKTKWFRGLLLVVLGFIAAGLFSLTGGGTIGACLGIILIPVSTFVIPYWLGERSLKTLAINIVPVFVIAIVIISAMQTQSIVAQGRPALTSGVDPATPNASLPALTLWNGTVDPYGAPSSNQIYVFHVRLKLAANVSANRTTVYVNVSQFSGFSRTDAFYPMQVDTNTTNGTWYVVSESLPPGIYGFYFSANSTPVWTSANSTFSSAVFAPVSAPWTDWYGFWLLYVAYEMIFPVSFYFIILFMYWYTVRTRRTRARLLETAQKKKAASREEAPKETAKDASVGAGETSKSEAGVETTKKAALFTCTNCGADVTEDDEKCPKCGAVFED